MSSRVTYGRPTIWWQRSQPALRQRHPVVRETPMRFRKRSRLSISGPPFWWEGCVSIWDKLCQGWDRGGP